jgi:MoaA/NifB/PqqE/SkfB family radical SAM enzyme
MCDIGQREISQEFYKVIESKESLDFELFKKIIDDVRIFFPVIAINLTEPLLKKDIVRYLEYIDKSNLSCDLTTNGYLLEELAEELVKANLSVLNVSIDGTSEIHNRIRGVSDSFERASRGISAVMDAKKRLGKGNPKVFVAYVISNHNANDLYNTIEYFKRLGADGVHFTHLSFISPAMAENHNRKFSDIYEVKPSSISVVNPDDVDEAELTEEIKKVVDDFGDIVSFVPHITSRKEIETYYKNPERFVSAANCQIPWFNAQILANGDVLPSSRCFHIIMGNVKENSFMEVWNGKKFKDFRKFLIKHNVTPACSRCCGIL